MPANNTLVFVDDILSTKQCSEMLGLGYKTLLNKIALKQDLPTAYSIPETRGYRFIKSEVIAWLKTQPSTKPKKKRGRPRGSRNKV